MKYKKEYSELKSKDEKAFMAHVYYGDPKKEFSDELIKRLIENGIDILELGIPFSDPTADGPTFVNVCTRALKNRMTPRKCIQAIKKIRKYSDIPIIVTSYFNIVYQYGIKKFIKNIKQAGVQGLIIPELVIEESDELDFYGKKYEIDIIYLIGPYSSEKRIKKIVKKSSGFIYVVSKTGVTGAREKLQIETSKTIKKLKKFTTLPLLVGFGISKKEHVKEIIKAGADGVIIGSAIAKIYEKYIENGKIINKEKCLSEISEFVKEIKKVCKNDTG
jgi:tryptophan synthase alpha chain